MHLVRAATLTGFEELLTALGGSAPDALLARAGLPDDTLSTAQEDRFLPQRRLERLLELAAEATGCAHFGLLLGSRQELSMLGVVGFVMQQSPDVRTALEELQRHFYLQAQGSALEIELGYRTAQLAFVVHAASELPSIRHTSELCLAAGVPVMRALCGSSFRATAVHFAHRAPADLSPYRRVFAAPVLFNQEQNAVSFPVALLDTEISSADAQLNRILHTYLDILDRRYADDPVSQVAHLIRRAMASGTCSADGVAAFMGMHRRSLHRLLKREGTSFTALLERVRRELAVRTLAQSDLSITVLSDMLCYSDVSAFTRAFGRWFDTTPSAWRAARRHTRSNPVPVEE